jgi:protein-S-isoprenylcysteine O-methyltransferase Ste14
MKTDGMRRPVSERDAIRSQVIDALEAQEIKETSMEKSSTAAVVSMKNFSQKLTIGLDLGDRSSWYCVLDEAGNVIDEQKVGTTPKAMTERFAAMPRSRIGTSVFRLIGLLLIAVGLPILLDSFARFALQGLGTPAPIFPTRHLVVSGLFRFVRNPMYIAVMSLILGQGLFFGSIGLLEYGVAVWVGFHLFILIYEEPTLRSRYGHDYQEFCEHVPRWIPRPWRRGKK